jgi:hypothetical protein
MVVSLASLYSFADELLEMVVELLDAVSTLLIGVSLELLSVMPALLVGVTTELLEGVSLPILLGRTGEFSLSPPQLAQNRVVTENKSLFQCLRMFIIIVGSRR